MKDVYILGIESSCDETSCSIVANGRKEIATIISSQIDIHKEYGGVVPEIASREHVKNITIVIEECLKKANMSMEDIDAIAITYGPGLIGSLLIGLEAAKTLAFIYNKPLVPVHHIAGHIYANSLEKEMKFPLLALIVSGGHTELVIMEDHYKFKKLGGTLDDAIGECYDKVARVIGLEYPGGPKVDKLASIGKSTYNLPIPLNDDSYNFSFSGLKSAVINLNHKLEQRGEKENSRLIVSLLENESKQIHKEIKITSSCYHTLLNTTYEGNVGELKNILKQTCMNALFSSENKNCITINNLHLPHSLSITSGTIMMVEHENFTLEQLKQKSANELGYTIIKNIQKWTLRLQNNEILLDEYFDKSYVLVSQ